MAERDPLETLLRQPDRPVAPSPHFARQLRARVMADLASDVISEEEERSMQHVSTVRSPWSAPATKPSLSSARRGRRWMPLLEIAAVTLLMLSAVSYLGVGRFWAGRPAVQPGVSTPGAAATGAAMWGGDAARSGRLSASGPAGEVGIRWRSEVSDGPYGNAPLVALNGRVYRGSVDFSEAGDQGVVSPGLEAIDARSGARLWRTDLELFGCPAVTDDLIYVTVMEMTDDQTSSLVALRVDSGQEAWRVATGRITGALATSPVVADDTVYVTDPDGTVYARDARSGSERWTSTAARTDDSRLESRDGAPGSMPGATGTFAYGNGAVYVVDGHGDVHALDAATGQTRWKIDIRDRFRINPEVIYPVAVDGAVVLSLRGFDATSRGLDSISMVATIEAATGQNLWSKEFPKLFDSVAVANDRVLVPIVDSTPKLIALDLMTGDARWEFADVGAGGRMPTVDGNAVYLGGESGTVRALALSDGKEVWRVSVGNAVTFAPVTTHGIALVVDVEGTVSAIAEVDRGATPSTP